MIQLSLLSSYCPRAITLFPRKFKGDENTKAVNVCPGQTDQAFHPTFENKRLMKCWACFATWFGLITFVWQCWAEFDVGQNFVFRCCVKCWICLTTPTNISPNILFVFINMPLCIFCSVSLTAQAPSDHRFQAKCLVKCLVTW